MKVSNIWPDNQLVGQWKRNIRLLNPGLGATYCSLCYSMAWLLSIRKGKKGDLREFKHRMIAVKKYWVCFFGWKYLVDARCQRRRMARLVQVDRKVKVIQLEKRFMSLDFCSYIQMVVLEFMDSSYFISTGFRWCGKYFHGTFWALKYHAHNVPILWWLLPTG